MIRPPLGKLHHYESRTALVRGTNHHCGREPGTIESRGCNTGELTPAAHCGSALIEIERLQYPPSIPSAILAISEVDCVTHSDHPRLPSPYPPLPLPVLRPHHPRTIGRGQKINASLEPAFHQLRGSEV